MSKMRVQRTHWLKLKLKQHKEIKVIYITTTLKHNQ